MLEENGEYGSFETASIPQFLQLQLHVYNYNLQSTIQIQEPVPAAASVEAEPAVDVRFYLVILLKLKPLLEKAATGNNKYAWNLIIIIKTQQISINKTVVRTYKTQNNIKNTQLQRQQIESNKQQEKQ
jgi:hypothetical protein